MGNGEEVGKISYSVVIDVSALKASTKTAEQAIKTSFSAGEKDIQKFAKSADSSFSSVTKSLAVLTASFLSLRTISNVLGDSVDAANKFQASMLGLESVSNAFIGETSGATEAARALSSDGLLPLADAATGLKNLLAAGYGLPEAITLMERFKDSAAFGRQGSLSFGEAVRSATEGIKNGNSILVDNAGVTKNLSVILQEAGYSAQDLQKASTDVGVRMAILNGIIRETNAQVGDSTKLTETAAGADANLAKATGDLSIAVGNLTNNLREGATRELANFIQNNQKLIVGVASGTAAAVAFGVAFLGLAKIIPPLVVGLGAMRGIFIANAAAQAAFTAGNIPLATSLLAVRAAAIKTVASLTLIGTAMAVVGVVVGNAIAGMTEEIGTATTEIDDSTLSYEQWLKSVGKTDPALSGAGNSVDKLSKKLSDLNEQIAKVERDYTENLARIVQGHQKSITDLTKQIENENEKYNAAVRERFTAFQEEQGKEQSEHAKKVKTLQNQIDFLRKYQHSSNRQQLSDLQFALAQENAEYTKRNAERQEKYDADAEAERISHEQRLSENQEKLNEELALLNKHKDAVKAVRGVILLDEIEALNRSRQEQLISIEKERKQAVEGAKTTYSQLQNEYQKYLDDIAKKRKMAILEAELAQIELAEELRKQNGPEFQTGNFLKDYGNAIAKHGPLAIFGKGWAYRYNGGPVSAGTPYFVGENKDGSLNSTSELFVPKTSGTIVPAMEVQKALGGMGGGGGDTYNLNFSISGAIVSSPQDQRKFAEVIGKKINEVMQQKGFRPALEGM